MENPFSQFLEFCVCVFRFAYRVARWMSRTVSDSLCKKPNSVLPAIFFALLVTQFVQPADMEEENPVKRAQELLKYWGGKSLHPIDIVYQPKCVQLA